MKQAPIRITSDTVSTPDSCRVESESKLPPEVERLELWPDGRIIAFGWDWQREATPSEAAILVAEAERQAEEAEAVP